MRADDALGTLDQCVMSLYGAARMLGARDLGPAQITPALADLRRLLDAFEIDLERMVADQESEARGALAVAARTVGQAVRVTMAEAKSAFALDAKLSARRRLLLERETVRLGGNMQAARRLLSLCQGALHPHPIELTLSDLLRGQWSPRPAFVAATVEVCVEMAHVPLLEGDPRVLWAMFERSLADIAAAGTSTVFGLVTDEPRMIRVGDVGPLPRKSLLHVRVELGASSPAEDLVLEAVSQHLGWTREVTAHEVRIALAVA